MEFLQNGKKCYGGMLRQGMKAKCNGENGLKWYFQKWYFQKAKMVFPGDGRKWVEVVSPKMVFPKGGLKWYPQKKVFPKDGRKWARMVFSKGGKMG